MKNFISKNWKNILFIIGGIFILIDLLGIIITPATIPQDFLEYGPNIDSDLFDKVNNVTSEIKDLDVSGEASNFIPEISSNTSNSPDFIKLILVFGAFFIIIIILSNIIEGSGDKR